MLNGKSRKYVLEEKLCVLIGITNYMIIFTGTSTHLWNRNTSIHVNYNYDVMYFVLLAILWKKDRIKTIIVNQAKHQCQFLSQISYFYDISETSLLSL